MMSQGAGKHGRRRRRNAFPRIREDSDRRIFCDKLGKRAPLPPAPKKTRTGKAAHRIFLALVKLRLARQVARICEHNDFPSAFRPGASQIGAQNFHSPRCQRECLGKQGDHFSEQIRREKRIWDYSISR